MVPTQDSAIILTEASLYLFDSNDHPMRDNYLIDSADYSYIGAASTRVPYAKLSNQKIDGNWCLAVSNGVMDRIGTFTLKVTRNNTDTTTTVSNESFANNDEITFNRSILASSPFRYRFNDGNDRYGHYFMLHNLDNAYKYSFTIVQQPPTEDFIRRDYVRLFLYDIHTKSLMATARAPVDSGNPDPSINNRQINTLQDGCLVVTTRSEQSRGPFVLKITRVLI